METPMVPIQRILTLVFSVSVITAQPLFAQSNTSIGSGATTLRFAPTFESTVSTSGLTIQALEESNVFQGLFIFPILEGVIDLDSARGDIIHGGGFSLTGQNLDVRFYNLIIDTTGATPFVSADLVVNDAMVVRIALFDLQLPPLTLPLDARTGVMTISSTSVTLRSEAANILNQIVGASTFRGGEVVGLSELTLIIGQSGM
jgi:hypothetical protein